MPKKIETPTLSEELIDYLDTLFPEKCADLTQNDKEIFYQSPPMVTNATTTKDAPKQASSTSAVSQNTAMKKRRGRGSLRIPLTSSGLSQSGTNFPTS